MSTSYALYLHIPFCRQRCTYCDFNTYTTISELQPLYVEALAREIEQVGATGVAGDSGRAAVGTIFFGGGTPSLLTPQQVDTLLSATRRAFDVAADAEITMEANPGTVNEAYLAAVRALGVNRLSYGVQSTLPDELALLGREHSFIEAIDALTAARAAGFDNVNLDLIYGLPGQSVDNWRRTLLSVLPLGVEHISLYCLTIEPGTPLQRWLNNGQMIAPDPDTAADQYELACEELAAAGFGHYEISNWAHDGRECRHNLVYWRNQPYLGLGAGAHGLGGGYRYQVVRQPRAYIRRMIDANGGAQRPFPLTPAVAAHHAVDAAEAMGDTILTQLRLLDEGLDLDAFARRFGRPFDEVYGDTVGELEEMALLRRDDGRLLLTERGRFLSNQVFYRLI